MYIKYKQKKKNPIFHNLKKSILFIYIEFNSILFVLIMQKVIHYRKFIDEKQNI